MLITKNIILELNKRNFKIYKNKLNSKYDLKIGPNEISIRDLSIGSHYLVEVKCDSCDITNNIEWRNYLKYTNNETDIYCCKKCNICFITPIFTY
jgi:hypothetical protein